MNRSDHYNGRATSYYERRYRSVCSYEARFYGEMKVASLNIHPLTETLSAPLVTLSVASLRYCAETVSFQPQDPVVCSSLGRCTASNPCRRSGPCGRWPATLPTH